MFRENSEFVKEQDPERASVDYSGRRELAMVLERLGLKDRTISELTPLEREAVLREGEEIQRREMMLPADKTPKHIALEVASLFEEQANLPDEVIKKIAPIHQYFIFLIEKGKATAADERRYLECYYGWGPRDDDSLALWDTRLAKLATFQRAKMRGEISEEEFNKKVLEL